eukprot:scaffold43575_cov41-Cyclotella_meneghiniana.AAC.4
MHTTIADMRHKTTTLTMASSLQIYRRQNQPISTTTLTNASATGVGAGGVDLAAISSSFTLLRLPKVASSQRAMGQGDILPPEPHTNTKPT